MTAIVDLLSVIDRRSLEDRLAEWRELDREMRKPGLLPGSAEPPPLHRSRSIKNSVALFTAGRTTSL